MHGGELHFPWPRGCHGSRRTLTLPVVALFDPCPVLPMLFAQVAVDPEIQAPELLAQLFERGADALLRELPDVWAGRGGARAQPQDEAATTHAAKVWALAAWGLGRNAQACLWFPVTVFSMAAILRQHMFPFQLFMHNLAILFFALMRPPPASTHPRSWPRRKVAWTAARSRRRCCTTRCARLPAGQAPPCAWCCSLQTQVRQVHTHV